MGQGNDFFMRMCREAMEEVAKGDKTWREIETNTLLLACVGTVMNHLTHKITRPLWFFAGSVFAAMVAWIISLVVGG